MRSHVALLLRLIARYRLDDRYPAVAQLRILAEMGKLSETQAGAYLRWLEPLIKEVEAQRNYLARSPTRVAQLRAPSGTRQDGTSDSVRFET